MKRNNNGFILLLGVPFVTTWIVHLGFMTLIETAILLLICDAGLFWYIWHFEILGSKRLAIIMTICWATLGVALDYGLGLGLGLWKYNNFPYNSLWYWILFPNAWAWFGWWARALWHSLEPSGHWRPLFLLFMIMGINEFVGYFWWQTWSYNAPLWLIIVGWAMLSLCYGIIPDNIQIIRRVVMFDKILYEGLWRKS